MQRGRNSEGRFTSGNQHGRGRPPRNYSISHALALAAEEPESVDDHGNTLTKAQVAARFLWDVVSTRKWNGKDVSFKDWLCALQTILSRIEPVVKLTAGELQAEEEKEFVERLQDLSPEELKVLQKVGLRMMEEGM